MMRAGGNAVDAAVAANAVLGVAAPETCGVGGDLFALVFSPGASIPAALNSSGRAGSGASPEAFQIAGMTSLPQFDVQTVTVPGCVDGWEALLARFGSITMAEAVAPAIRLAETGFPVSAELALSLATRAPALAADDGAADLYPEGRPPELGRMIRRPQLVDTLRQIVEGGRTAFYEGGPGKAITTATEGNIMSADLERVQAEWVEPLGKPLFGMTGWTIPPNSQGYLTLACCRIAEMLGVDRSMTDASWHTQIEAYRALAAERDDLVSDPGSAPVPPDYLLDDKRLAELAGSINPERAARWPGVNDRGTDTAYMCTLDRSGMGVSLIQSNFMGLGSNRAAAGFILHNRGAGFDLRLEHPNLLAPGKRPLHTLSPTLWTRPGGLALLLGTRGGHQQPQLLLQMAVHLLVSGHPAESAQALPRWALDHFGPGSDSSVKVEPATPVQLVEGLRRRGHEVEVLGLPQRGWGPVAAIRIDEGGGVTAAADPRSDTASAAA
jgi:gamma-glutamyltranspeptidase/glutathione hydrolase